MSDGDKDPFADLREDVEHREGDPFEHLETGDGNSDTDGDSAETSTDTSDDFVVERDPSPTGDEAGRFDPPREQVDDPPDDRHGDQRDNPAAGTTHEATVGTADSGDGGDGRFEGEERLSPSFEDIDARDGDPFESLGAFEDRSVEDVDPDVVWQTLASAETEGSVTADRERTFAEVSKHSYCEQCEHFSQPPDVACGHEGTEIVEFRDMETVRLVDCPVVAERRRLQRRD
ncbi:MAG: hypothetical protein V5A55_13905 [Halovenus sp.]